MESISVSQVAPQFVLKDQKDQDVDLLTFRGKKVLLSFHPLAWTGVCAEQMLSLEKNYQRFEELNTIPLGLSVDAVPSKKAWAEHLNIQKIRLLADFWPHGGVAQDYGLFRESHGTSYRANVLIGEEGKILWVKTYPLSQLPDIEDVLETIRALREQSGQ